MNRLRALALVLVVAGAMLVAGCGGGDTNTSTGSTATLATPTDGILYEDPAGAYTIAASPDWTEASVQTPKAWFLPQGTPQFRDNVNMLVERLPEGVDLEKYVDLSLTNAPKLVQDLKVISNDRVTLASGERGARLRFSGSAAGRTLHFLQIYAVATGSRAVVVTLTAPADRIAGDTAAAEPYMRTVVVKP